MTPRRDRDESLDPVVLAVKDAVTFDHLYALLDREHPGLPVLLPEGWSFAWSEAAEDRLHDVLLERLTAAGWTPPARRIELAHRGPLDDQQ